MFTFRNLAFDNGKLVLPYHDRVIRPRRIAASRRTGDKRRREKSAACRRSRHVTIDPVKMSRRMKSSPALSEARDCVSALLH